MKGNRPKRFCQSGVGLRGHTLAEVILALALFSLLAYAAISAVAAGLEVMAGERTGNPEARAERFVRHVIMRVPSRSELEAGGEVSLSDGREVRWSATVEPTPLLGVHHLEAVMHWQGDEGEEVEIERKLFLYRPAWSDSAEQEQIRENKEEWFEERRRSRGRMDE